MSKHIVIDGRIRRSSTGRYVDRLVKHLQAIDHINLYSILVADDDDWVLEAKNFQTVKTKYRQFSLNPLDEIGFTRQLHKLKADLVHFTTNAQPVFYFKPSVTTTMDFTMLDYTRPGKSPLPIFWLKMMAYRFLFWLGNYRSKHIIAISNFVKTQLEDKYASTRGKITITHCASEPPLTADPVPVEDVSKPFVFYVGTAFPHKNLDRLIEAFAVVKKSYPGLTLVLSGKIEYHYLELIKFINSSAVRDSVVVTGYVSDPQLKWLYQNAEAYVFPSLSEGFGLPALEAFVHGTPVISSNATCLPEICGEAALYFDPLSVHDIAIKITELLGDDDLKQQLVEKGYAQASKYSWRTMAEKTLEVYQKVLP
jgi:glycosyltransferase involved in cell wall biosynthesis